MSNEINTGDRILVESNGEVYHGVVDGIGRNTIQIRNVYCQTQSSTYPGILTFYRDEIGNKFRTLGTSTSKGKSIQNCNGHSNKIKMHPDEFQRLQDMTFEFIFIDSFSKKFEEAVKELNNRESVAVAGLGSTHKRGKPLSLLLMADFKQVYIFDMLALVQLRRELKDIFESRYVTKVVHGGEDLFDCLYHKYNVEMVNVFDTQVVDSVISKTEEEVDVKRSLSECLSHHFNFPLSLLDTIMEDMTKDKIWMERPLLKTEKTKAAQLVAYLITLRDHFLEKILKPYSDVTRQIYKPYKHLSAIEILTKKMNLCENTANDK